MIIMPTFAQRQQSDDYVISALIVALKRLASPKMAGGIDAPGDVVNEEDAENPAPHETPQRPAPASRE